MQEVRFFPSVPAKLMPLPERVWKKVTTAPATISSNTRGSGSYPR